MTVHTGAVGERRGVRKVLAVVAIVALLTVIVWPIIIDQRKKAVDADVKADLTAVEDAIGQYVAEHDATPTMTIDGLWVLLDGVEVTRLHAESTGVEFTADSTTAWCLAATNPHGKHAADPGYRYKVSKDKIDTGVCG